MIDLAREHGLPAGAVRNRLYIGWSLHRALTEPHLADGKLKIPYCDRCKERGERVRPGCEGCAKARVKLWHKTHRKARKIHVRSWRARNLDRAREIARATAKRRQAECTKYTREWRRLHPRKRLEQHRRANARRYYGPEFSEAYRQLRDLEKRIAGKPKKWKGKING